MEIGNPNKGFFVLINLISVRLLFSSQLDQNKQINY